MRRARGASRRGVVSSSPSSQGGGSIWIGATWPVEVAQVAAPRPVADQPLDRRLVVLVEAQQGQRLAGLDLGLDPEGEQRPDQRLQLGGIAEHLGRQDRGDVLGAPRRLIRSSRARPWVSEVSAQASSIASTE